jgi:hypothetical protein
MTSMNKAIDLSQWREYQGAEHDRRILAGIGASAGW